MESTENRKRIGKRAAFHNLGCKVNSYETEAMLQALEAKGYELVSFEEQADVYIVNTCSVTNIADRKSRQMLHRAKKKNPNAVVVAVGCYVQAAGEAILEDAGVDIAIGNNKKADLVRILEEYFDGHGESFVQVDIAKEREYEPLHIQKVNTHTRAYLKVQDGCNQFCSYCIIPYVRGRIRSRALEEIVCEVEQLAASGVKEVVLTGIHLSSYGLDKQEEGNKNRKDVFASEILLEMIQEVAKVDGIERIRLGSLEPRIITEEFVSRLCEISKLCPHFHLSLQSGCDETLKRMNRHYTAEQYAAKCEILRRFFDNPAITTDVIVGFPGETEGEFEETRKFLQKLRLYEMHIFKYSARKGTVAADMKEQVDEQVKTKRSNILLEMEKELSEQYRRQQCGEEKSVLWEEICQIDGKDYLTGYTREYVRAAMPATPKTVKLLGTVSRGMLTDDMKQEIMGFTKLLQQNVKCIKMSPKD